jgi:hypothetical protein
MACSGTAFFKELEELLEKEKIIKKGWKYVRSEVFMTASVKTTDLWHIAPCTIAASLGTNYGGKTHF